MLNTAVALVVFDRPDVTELVFHAIALAKPRRLFVFGDGPRTPIEAELCARSRAVTENIDWDCDVSYAFSEVNLGCRDRYASAVDRVFAEVNEAIIFDDDCVPDQTFFPFCEAMLERYRNDPRVMMVSGSNYLDRWKVDRQSYHFSAFGSVWGWATWKRAWATYDITMAAWGDDEVRARIRADLADDEVFAHVARRFDWLRSDEAAIRHSYDLPWMFARLAQGGLSIVPAVNLITNVGNVDGRGVTPTHPIANLQTGSLPLPLRFQEDVAVDRTYDLLHIRRLKAPLLPSEPQTRESSAGGGLARAPRRLLRRALRGIRQRV